MEWKEDHESYQKDEGVLYSQMQQADRCAEKLEQFDQTCEESECKDLYSGKARHESRRAHTQLAMSSSKVLDEDRSTSSFHSSAGDRQ